MARTKKISIYGSTPQDIKGKYDADWYGYGQQQGSMLPIEPPYIPYADGRQEENNVGNQLGTAFNAVDKTELKTLSQKGDMSEREDNLLKSENARVAQTAQRMQANKIAKEAEAETRPMQPKQPIMPAVGQNLAVGQPNTQPAIPQQMEGNVAIGPNGEMIALDGEPEGKPEPKEQPKVEMPTSQAAVNNQKGDTPANTQKASKQKPTGQQTPSNTPVASTTIKNADGSNTDISLEFNGSGEPVLKDGDGNVIGKRYGAIDKLLKMKDEIEQKNQKADQDYRKRLAGWKQWEGIMGILNSLANMYTATKSGKTAKYYKQYSGTTVENELARVLNQQRADNQQLYTNALNAYKLRESESKNDAYMQYLLGRADALSRDADRKDSAQNAKNKTEEAKQGYYNAQAESEATESESKAMVAKSTAEKNRAQGSAAIMNASANQQRAATQAINTANKPVVYGKGVNDAKIKKVQRSAKDKMGRNVKTDVYVVNGKEYTNLDAARNAASGALLKFGSSTKTQTRKPNKLTFK